MKKKKNTKAYIKKIRSKITELKESLDTLKLKKAYKDDALQEQLELWDEHLRPYELAYAKAKKKVKNRKRAIKVLEKLVKEQGKGKHKKPSKSKQSKKDTIPAPARNISAAVKENDLKKIEGIGPKIEQILKAADIRTFAHLAITPVDTLKSILEQAGNRFRMHQPDSWPEQAALAANGDWITLKALQDELDGGKKT